MSAKRNDVIEAFDLAVVKLESYIEAVRDSEECARLVGVLPDLRDARHRFELASMPEEP
jgi:hypothetical protein